MTGIEQGSDCDLGDVALVDERSGGPGMHDPHRISGADGRPPVKGVGGEATRPDKGPIGFGGDDQALDVSPHSLGRPFLLPLQAR